MVRLTGARRKILSALLDVAPGELFALELSRRAGLASGSLYPALRTLREAGLIAARWEEPDGDLDRGPRRYYQLTPDGVALATDLAAGKVHGTGWRPYLPGSPS